MQITMDVKGADRVAAKMRRAVGLASDGPARVTQEYGDILLETVKQNASGRPGPNIITGQYVGSIQIIERSMFSVKAGTGAPQANRLENGFTGVDSIGRHYNQPAFPHWQPAVDTVGPQYLAAMRAEVNSWF